MDKKLSRGAYYFSGGKCFALYVFQKYMYVDLMPNGCVCDCGKVCNFAPVKLCVGHFLVCYKGENGTKYCKYGQKIFYKGYVNGFSRSNGWCFYKCNGSWGFS